MPALNLNLGAILLPIFEMILQLLNQVLELGYDELSEAQKTQLKSYLPTVYVFLRTKGKEFAESTSTTLDDVGVKEFVDAIENIAQKEGFALPVLP